MSKKWFTRLTRIASGSFGSAKEDGFSLETSLTKFERFVHFWVLVGRSFVRNRCPVRASALSYTTLLALIPILAVVMSITSALLKSQGEESIKQFIERFVDNIIPSTQVAVPAKGPILTTTNNPSAADSLAALSQFAAEASNKMDAIQIDETEFRAAFARANDTTDTNAPPIIGATATLTNQLTPASSPLGDTNQQAVAEAGVVQAKKNAAREAANYIYGFARKSYSGTLGITGTIFLVLTAILTLTRVEETFNDIWGVSHGRDWWSRITNYFFTIALGPALIIAAFGLARGPNFEKVRDLIIVVPFIEPLLSTYLPLILICLTFTLFYKLVPNTKVDFSAALVGGSLAGVLWHVYNHLGFLLASRAVSASAIYGGLAIVPLLMGGLYIVWLTVLFGAQVAYAFQNRASYLQDRLVENVNQRGREFVALRLMTCIGQRFDRGLSPATIREISKELGIPSQLVQQVLRTLLAARLVVEVNGIETGYSPARPLETINCHHILLAMRATHGQEPATRDEPVRVEVLGEFARIQAAEEHAAAAVSMLALVNRAQARLELAAATESNEPVKVEPSVDPIEVAVAANTPSADPAVPEVKFGEPEPSNSGVAAAPDEEFIAATPDEADDSKLEPAKSISSPTPAVTTNEDESFPL